MIRNTMRAIFWVAITAAFVPAGFSAAPDGAFARSAADLWKTYDAEQQTRVLTETANTSTSAFCEEQSEACAVGDQIAAFGGLLFNMVSDRAGDWVAEQQMQTSVEYLNTTAEALPAASRSPSELDALLTQMSSQPASVSSDIR